MKPVLVIGDVHGHYDRLQALLEQEGIIDAEGKRINTDVEVIQLGDLGHFGTNGSPTGDRLCYEAAAHESWLDLVLWGNHDRYVVDPKHAFGGCAVPDQGTADALAAMFRQGRMALAAERHGVLLTHAGLHKAWKMNKVDINKTDPAAVAEFINTVKPDDPNRGVVDNISIDRGGRAREGGILWRDAREALYDCFPQVFGHTKGEKVRTYMKKGGVVHGWCVDVGSPYNGRLAGIWLPDMRQVEVDLGLKTDGKLPEGVQYLRP